MVAAGDDPSAIPEQTRDQMVQQFATLAGVPPSAVRLTVVAASLLLTFEITSYSATEVEQAVTTLSSALTTPESASAVLSGTGVDIITAPAVSNFTRIVEFPFTLLPHPPSVAPTSPSPPPRGDLGVFGDEAMSTVPVAEIAIGSSVGVVLLLALIGVVVGVWCCRRKRPSLPDKLSSTTVEISMVGQESSSSAGAPPPPGPPPGPPPPEEEEEDAKAPVAAKDWI
jgi:hypothetical protein